VNCTQKMENLRTLLSHRVEFEKIREEVNSAFIGQRFIFPVRDGLSLANVMVIVREVSIPKDSVTFSYTLRKGHVESNHEDRVDIKSFVEFAKPTKADEDLGDILGGVKWT
jgi:hypothetical protein